MSVVEFIFVDTELSPEAAAAEIAHALDMHLVRDDKGKVFVGAESFGGIPGELGGEIYRNIYGGSVEPADRAPYMNHSLVWEVRRPHSDEDTQVAAARAVFLAVTERLSWPAVFVHDLDLALAAWDPDRGLREFPPGTSVDAMHEHIWG